MTGDEPLLVTKQPFERRRQRACLWQQLAANRRMRPTVADCGFSRSMQPNKSCVTRRRAVTNLGCRDDLTYFSSNDLYGILPQLQSH